MAVRHHSRFTTNVSSPPCEAFGWLQPQHASLGACYQWCSLPLLLSARPPNPRQNSLYNTCIAMASPCSWQRLRCILSHTCCKQDWRHCPGVPPHMASFQLGSWSQAHCSARLVPRLPAAALSKAGVEAVAHGVPVSSVLLPIAVTISIMCLRPADPEPWDVACHGGQTSCRPLQLWDSV